MFEKNELLNNTNLIIDHNRVFKVENITKKEIKQWGKLSKSRDWQYIILDKDYWKSPELMRYVVEEIKPVWFGIYILIWFLGIIFVWITIFLITLFFDNWSKKIVPENNIISIPPTTKPIIIKENSNTWNIQPIPTNNLPVINSNSWVVDIRDNADYIELNTQFFALQDQIKVMEKDAWILQYKFENCSKNNTPTIVTPECKNSVIEKELTEIEKFHIKLWKQIAEKCDLAIKTNSVDSWLCKDIYSNFLIK